MRRDLLLTAAIIAAVSVGGGFVLKQDAMAQTTSVSLADTVRAAVGASINDAKADKGPQSSIELSETLLSGEMAQLELERQAEDAAAKAAADTVKRKKAHNRSSYKRASQGLLPLSPNQVRTFMKKLEDTQKAAQAPHAGTPTGEVKIASISLDPGTKPPVINLAAGYVTTIDIIDQTGEPWPILDVGIGGNFEVTPTKAGSHVVRVVPLTRVGDGNLSILLKDLSTPVIFRLSSGGSSYHMRFDARIPKLGPFAKTPLIQQAQSWPVAGGEVISMILENAPPAGAQRLKVSGLDSRTKAWKIGESVYVRTPLSLLSPAWNASASSADGMTVYEIGDAPILLMSDNGAMLRARLLREDNYDK